MTTIAYRSGAIAADTGLSAGPLLDSHIEKIAKHKDGSVAGASGEGWWITAFLEWFKNGGDLPVMPGKDYSFGIVISKRRHVTLYESGEGFNRFYQVKAPYHAIGAMFVGAHPVDAVKAAITHNDSTFGRVQQFKVGW